MDLVDKLRKEASSEHVAYTEFILKLKNHKHRLFCFFEGKDDNKYYGIRIESTTKTEYEVINCDGKENVIAVERLISTKKEYCDISKCYFIDQDYDGSPQIDNIYCLPSYSIENQYCSEKVLHKILKTEFSLDSTDEDFNHVCKLFRKLQSGFHKKTLFINAWLACQSDNRANEEKSTHLHIDSSIGKYFKSIISQDMKLTLDLTEINGVRKIKKLFPSAPVISQKEISEKLTKLKNKNAELVFRGKFEFIFFCKLFRTTKIRNL